MTRVIADDGLKARLKDFSEPLEICDEAGRILGFFHPGAVDSPGSLAWTDALFTEEELERARRDTGRHTTAEVLEYLKGL